MAVELWRFASPRAVSSVLDTLLASLDVVLVGALASTRQAAIYAAVTRVVVIGTYTMQAIGLALARQFSELVALRQFRRVELIYQVATWWMMALSWPLYTLLALFAPVFMSMFGEQYVPGQIALTILAIAFIFNLGTGNISLLLLMMGHSGLNLINSAVVLSVNVGLDILLIPRYGLEGAAVGWAVAIIAVNVAGLVEVHHLIRLNPFGVGYSKVLLACASTFGVVGSLARLALGASFAALALTVAIALPTYALLCWRDREVLGLSVISARLRRKWPSG